MMRRHGALLTALAASALLLIVLPVEGTAALRHVLLAVAVGALGWHAWHGRRPGGTSIHLPLWPLWLVYAGVALAGLLWAVDAPYSAKEIKLEIVLGAVCFWLGANLFRDAARWRWVGGGLLVGNVLLVGYCLVVWLSGGSTKDGLIGTYQTGVGNFSTYLATVAPLLALLAFQGFAARQRHRGLLLFLLAANIAAMYATANRQVLVALLVEILVLAAFFAPRLRQPRYLLGLTAALLTLGALFHFQMVSRVATANVAESANVEAALKADGRLPTWKFAIAESLKRPLTGGGLGRNTLKHLYPDHPMTDSVFVHAHNMLINRLVQLGVPGVLAFLALFGGVAGLMLSLRRRSDLAAALGVAGIAMCAGVFVKNMTDDFFVRELGYLFWLLSGAIIGVQSAARGEGQHG